MLTELINDDQCEKAYRYLAKTDEESALLKRRVGETEYLAKLAEQKAYLTQDGGSVADRKAKGDTAPEAITAWGEHWNAVQKFEEMRAKRSRADSTMELWRSVNSNRKLGLK